MKIGSMYTMTYSEVKRIDGDRVWENMIAFSTAYEVNYTTAPDMEGIIR